MAFHIDTTEYMYCSSYFRANEKNLFAAEELSSMAESGNDEAVFSAISEKGITVFRNENGVDTAKTFEEAYFSACKLVSESVPQPQLYDFLRFPYDCNNLKAALKCHFREIDPSSMLSNCGTRSAKDAVMAVSDKNNAAIFPENMARALTEASDAYLKTKNPQKIDAILDKACFADMLSNALNFGCELAVELVRARITFTNIMTCIRLIRMKMGFAGKALLSDAYLDGGKFDLEFFAEAYDGGEKKLYEMLEFTEYGNFAAEADKVAKLSSIERAVDNAYMEIVRKAKMIPFGPEVAIGYLVGREYDIKNLRILLGAIRSGMNSEITKERLRRCYV